MPSEPRKSSPEPVPGHGTGEGEVELGFVSGVFGVRGEVRLHLHNRASTLLQGEHTVILVHADGRRMRARLSARPGAGKRILGRIAGVGDPEEAATWMDWRVVVRAEDLPPLDESEFYVWQVEGLPVFVGGERIGEVASVHATQAGEVFEITVERAVAERIGLEDTTLFVPSTKELVLVVDVENGRVELSSDALS